MKMYYFVASLYLSDVLPCLSTLSLLFQKDMVNLTSIKPQVTATIAAVRLLGNQLGTNLLKLDDVLQSS